MKKNNDENKAGSATFLSKEMILGVDDIIRESVYVSEWGGSVLVKAMSGVERDAFEASLNSAIVDAETGAVSQVRNMENFRARLCSACMVNANDKLIFPNPEDVQKLGKKSSRALDKVMAAAQRINGIGVKEVEKITKN
jgi:hypothetical protein